VYLVGAGFVSTGLWRQARELTLIVRDASPLSTMKDSEALNHFVEQSGVWPRPRIVVSLRLSTPFAAGLIRPVIAVPAWVLSQLSPAQQRWIIAHELQHHARRDVWIAWFQNVLTVVWWFHPALWVLNRRLRCVREDCCDEAVLRDAPAKAADYAQALIAAARCMSRFPGIRTSLVPAVLENGVAGHGALPARVQRILQRRKDRRWRASWVTLVVACILGLMLLPGTSPSAGEDGATAEAPEEEYLTGQVVDPQGRPIAGAKIVTYPRIPGDQAISTESDEQGRFVIQGLKPLPGSASNRVSGAVYKSDMALAAFNSNIRPMRVVLHHADSLEISIQTPDGNPARQVTVRAAQIKFSEAFLTAPPPESIAQELTSMTDDEGHVTLHSVKRSALESVTVRSQTWGVQRLSVPRTPTEAVEPGEPIVLRLDEVGRIEGKVVNSEGNPLSDFQLFAISPINHAQGDRVRTDEFGTFEVILPVGRYRLGAHDVADGQSFSPRTIHLRHGETTKVEVTCEPSGKVTGRVITDSGRPASNVPIGFWRTGDRRILATDAEGRFEVDLPAGDWDYECSVFEIVGYVPPVGNEPRSVHVAAGESMSVPDWIVTSGAVFPGRIEGIDTSEPRIRFVLAEHNNRNYAAEYDAEGKFQLTIPRDVTIEEIAKFEVRFVEQPIEVVSYRPLVLRPKRP
jgi:hypothetical protein